MLARVRRARAGGARTVARPPLPRPLRRARDRRLRSRLRLRGVWRAATGVAGQVPEAEAYERLAVEAGERIADRRGPRALRTATSPPWVSRCGSLARGRAARGRRAVGGGASRSGRRAGPLRRGARPGGVARSARGPPDRAELARLRATIRSAERFDHRPRGWPGGRDVPRTRLPAGSMRARAAAATDSALERRLAGARASRTAAGRRSGCTTSSRDASPAGTRTRASRQPRRSSWALLAAALRPFESAPARSRFWYDLRQLTGWSSNLAANRLLSELGASRVASALARPRDGLEHVSGPLPGRDGPRRRAEAAAARHVALHDRPRPRPGALRPPGGGGRKPLPAASDRALAWPRAAGARAPARRLTRRRQRGSRQAVRPRVRRWRRRTAGSRTRA